MNGTHSTQMELNGVPISNKNPKMVLNLFFSSLISIGKQIHQNVFKDVIIFPFSVVFDILIVIAEDVIFNLFILFLIFAVGTINVLVITMLAKFPQGRTVGFATPGVPITPILGIAINFYLMLRLSPLTLIRFTVWMVLGKNDSHIRVVSYSKNDYLIFFRFGDIFQVWHLEFKIGR